MFDSIYEKLEKIHQSIDRHYGYNAWVRDVSDTQIVASWDNRTFMIDYTLTDDGEVIYPDGAQWVEVTQDWVTKSLKILKGMSTDDELYVQGYVALFGGKDLVGEYFTKNTDFESSYTKANSVLLDWEHGMTPDPVKNQPTEDDIFGKLDWNTAKTDDIGLLVTHVLDRKQAYVSNFVEPLLEAGLLGTSSEATPKAIVNKDGEIIKWPLKRQTFTVNPMEPKLLTDHQIKIVKSLGLQSLLKGDKESANSDSSPSNGDKNKMDPNKNESEYQKAVDSRFEKIEDTLGTIAESVKNVTDSVGGITKALEKIPAKSSSVIVEEDETDKKVKADPWKLGSLMHAVRAKAVNEELTKAQKAILGQNESIPSEGGYLVGTEQDSELMKKIHETAVFAGRASQRDIGEGANSVDFYGVREDSRANGNRLGGIQGYRVGRGQPIPASQMKFYKYTLKPEKYAAVVYSTNELLRDSRLAEQEVMDSVPLELAFMLDDDIMNGASAGYPKGILQADCLVTVAKDSGQTAATITKTNILNMWARLWSRSKPNAVWFVNQDTAPQLHQLEIGSGGSLLYRHPGTIGNDSPFGVLFGRPVVETEFNATLGTVGDIVLADMSQYKIARVGSGVQTASSIHVQFLTDQTAFRFTVAYDGQATWENALTPYKGSNTVSPFVALATRA